MLEEKIDCDDVTGACWFGNGFILEHFRRM